MSRYLNPDIQQPLLDELADAKNHLDDCYRAYVKNPCKLDTQIAFAGAQSDYQHAHNAIMQHKLDRIKADTSLALAGCGEAEGQKS